MTHPERIGSRISTWGEGPIWHAEKQRLFYVDIEQHTVVSFDPASGDEQSWEVGERVGFVVPRYGSDDLIIGGDNGIHILNVTDGSLTTIGDPEAGIETHRFNDGKCAPDGRLFAGTISMVKKPEAALYRVDPDHSITKVVENVTNSNGIVWSKDGSTCFYIDTATRKISAFDYDSTTGSLTNRRDVADTDPMVDASPDGMAIDTQDRLWVAFCHGGCVLCIDPATGECERRIDFPCVETTAVAFGGPDMTDLYVTTGIHKSIEEDQAGSLFVVRGVGATGAPQPQFKG
ncbi:SMP-30/gluconolactonase/LRE family protein [Sulfuriroseicoccus oceanibius]|uniref:SMP-30/gluconolactonase/LRE family protein n=1 Tax=Sulfuriroseicoccus oceanibius TaxID=2707525 RepID=A0A6B3L6J5_9BACT|nr:SMP-30/gluconolactonase/LRE family protein [Sulfuriroseicoccus oceanibius]QQL46215.1 SMP-30/gluconolactonase/LRE family protein [Sulfuriroseicoccus oceanibius]